MKIPILIDFEASGFGNGSYPIEVGFVTPDGLVWCCLIKPEDDWKHWSEEAAGLHQITREVLFEHGHSARFVAEQLNLYLAHADVYTDAWLHDYVWLARLFEVAKLSPRFKLKDLRQILTLEQLAAWDKTKSLVLEDLKLTRHRASSDAKVLQLTWLRTWQQPAELC